MLYYIRDDNNHLIGFEYKNTRYYYQKNIQEDISLITSIKILIGMQIIQIVWEENLKVMGKFLHFGTDENENYKKVKKYLNMPYPKYTHIMQLDDSFDYLGSICLKFLRNKKFLGKIITFEEFEEKKIQTFVEQNPDVEINDMINYYNLSLTIFEIIKKYYNRDGTKK